MGVTLDHIRGSTFHGRRGAVRNAFTYGVDYVLTDLSEGGRLPLLFARNSGNLMSLHDSDHGGERGKGRGVAWVREVLAAQGLAENLTGRILLLSQPRVFGYVFNPVSFWLVHDANDELCLVIAEVNNTYGDRHSYLCHHDDLRPIRRTDTLTARKIFYVSPFQPVKGTYTFRFDITDQQIGIWIDYRSGEDGVLATLTGKRTPLTSASILKASLARPLGSLRVMALIHWQALKLKLKGAVFGARPTPPAEDVSR
jgi:DUF1365 family protein